MSKVPPLRFRQIHLDFHTSPTILDVGVDFDARVFARTMKQAHVDSVTVFAKCHHGQLYYDTKHSARHPGLKMGLDLLGEQVDALHSENIRAPIYISVLCDEYAADTHPNWVALDAEGRRVGRQPLSGANSSWQILDMSSPYQDYLAEQTREILKRFKPVDGIFFDMCWDQPSVSRYAKAEMAQWKLNPAVEADRVRHAHRVALAYMKRFYDMVKSTSRDATVFFNGRGHGNLREEMIYQTQHEIESLPTGGWGYAYFPKNVRLARTLRNPHAGMTARFHKSWADFGGLKPQAALDYETQTPGDKLTKYAAATLNHRAAYIAAPVFGAYARHGNVPYRLLVRNLIEKLLPEPLLRVAAPAATEATVTRQPNRTIVHLLHYSPERRTERLDLIEDVIPLFDLPLSLKMEQSPERVYLAPDDTPVEFEHLAGRVNLRVPEVRGHAIIVFE